MSHDARVSLVLSPLVAAALGALTACGGGGGGSVSPGTNPSPIGSPIPTPTAGSGSPSPAPTASSPGSSPTPTARPGSPSPSPTPTGGPGSPSPSPTAVPTAAPVVVSPSTLSFLAAGSGVPGQTVAVAQAQNTGGFVLSTTNCAAIVSVAPASGAGPFTFLPVAAGTCSYLVTGSGGATAAIGITVTTTTVGSN